MNLFNIMTAMDIIAINHDNRIKIVVKIIAVLLKNVERQTPLDADIFIPLLFYECGGF